MFIARIYQLKNWLASLLKRLLMKEFVEVNIYTSKIKPISIKTLLAVLADFFSFRYRKQVEGLGLGAFTSPEVD